MWADIMWFIFLPLVRKGRADSSPECLLNKQFERASDMLINEDHQESLLNLFLDLQCISEPEHDG